MQFGRFSSLIIISLCLLACASHGVPLEMQAGKVAFENGEYQDAFHELLPIAVKGNPQAQYAVGYMYYYGYGVPEDVESGMFWMTRAAEQNYPPAIEALQIIREHNMEIAADENRRRQMDQRDAIMQSTVRTSPRRTTVTVIKSKPTQKVTTKYIQPVTLLHKPSPRISAPPQSSPPPSAGAVAIQKPDPHVAQNAPRNDDNSVAERNFTLQLFGSYHLTDVKGLQTRLRLKNSGHIYQTQFNGKDWYVLTFGNFITAHEASATKHNLPQGLKELNPWVRKIDSLVMV